MSGLGKLTYNEMAFIGVVIEGFFYGLYSAMFGMYIQHHASKVNKRNILLYALCILYILSTAAVVLDQTRFVVIEFLIHSSDLEESLLFRLKALSYSSTTINALCDFISQGILIYRCWVIWNRNIRVIIIPSFLALAFLATWLATNGSLYIVPDLGVLGIQVTFWGHIMELTSFAISLIVNAVVTGLIVLRILKMYWEVRSTFEDQNLVVAGGGAKLRSIVFIIIESGMAMFTVQLIRVVLTILQIHAVYLVITINQQLNGIAPTIILLRVSMGLSFYDEKSMEEAVESLRFATISHNENSMSEDGDTDIADQETMDPISTLQDDIQVVGRRST